MAVTSTHWNTCLKKTHSCMQVGGLNCGNQMNSVRRLSCGNQNNLFRLLVVATTTVKFYDWVLANKTINSDELVVAIKTVTHQQTVSMRCNWRIPKLTTDELHKVLWKMASVAQNLKYSQHFQDPAKGDIPCSSIKWSNVKVAHNKHACRYIQSLSK
jgi:hypothetical protein